MRPHPDRLLQPISTPGAPVWQQPVWAACAQVGDGTTTVVILAGELLRESKTFVEEGVHPRAIIQAYRQVCANSGFESSYVVRARLWWGMASACGRPSRRTARCGPLQV